MNEREYNRLKSEIEADYRKKLDALDLVWKMSGGVSKNGSRGSNAIIPKGSLLKTVRDILPHLQGEFSLHDVEDRIRNVNPGLAATLKRPSLSSALKRLESDHIISISTRGTGKRASKYRVGSAATG